MRANGPTGAHGRDGGRTEEESEEDGVKMVNSDDAVLSQLVQLQVAEGLPRADDCDVCGYGHKNSHLTDTGIVSKSI